MPGSEAEQKSGSHGDESINFRPSPNFKHMRKYLKYKFELEEMNAAASNRTQESASHSSHDNEEPEKAKKMESTIQPPLPPNSPPPDSPLTIKQEVVDDEYQCSNTTDSSHSSDISQPDETFAPATEQPTIATNKPEPIMCRNFVRGNCRKGSACIFVHEIILSQLPGVYTFCKNFQNKQCIHSKCKFVHATVFEKEYFFRTGLLPNHATAHMKPAPIAPPPPPPPPEEPIQPAAQVFPLATPTFGTSVAPAPVMGGAPVGPAVNHTPEMFNIITNNTSSPLKHEWSDSEEYSRSPRDLQNSEPLPKKCKDCDSNELRLTYMKNKVEKMCQGSQERNQQLAQLTKKHERLVTVLATLFKPGSSSNNANILGSSLYNISGEKEQGIMEQMNLLLNSNRLPFISDDGAKINNFLGNLNF